MNISPLIVAFIACQSIVVVFIAIHDWIPLGRLNNLAGIRAVDSKAKLLIVTVLSTLPFAIGLAGSAYYAAAGFPMWLLYWLWISYGVAVYGMMRTWWLPYLVKPDPARTARYQQRFANTHAFLPLRNGIRPDTLHVCFHLVLVTLVVLLAILSFLIVGSVMKYCSRYSGFLSHLLFLLTAMAGDAGSPQYNADSAFVTLGDYREWVFSSSGLDMSYSG